MTAEEKLTKTVTPQVLEDFYNEKILPFLNGMGVNYSTTEQKTGRKWIDGKDIYQCTFSDNVPQATTAGTPTTVQLRVLNNIKVVNIVQGVKNGTVLLPAINDSSKRIQLKSTMSGNDSTIGVFTEQALTTSDVITYTLQYTKTS